MKVDLLGANCSPSAAPMDHTLVPFVGLPAPSVQVNAVPPHSWTSIPRCCLYQACRATGSIALKKIPPIPVTLFIEPPRCGQIGAQCVSEAVLVHSALTSLTHAVFEQQLDDDLLLRFRDRRSTSTAARCPVGQLNRRGARSVWPAHIGASLNKCADGRCAPIADGPVQWHDTILIDRVGVGAGFEQGDNGVSLCVWVPDRKSVV